LTSDQPSLTSYASASYTQQIKSVSKKDFRGCSGSKGLTDLQKTPTCLNQFDRQRRIRACSACLAKQGAPRKKNPQARECRTEVWHLTVPFCGPLCGMVLHLKVYLMHDGIRRLPNSESLIANG